MQSTKRFGALSSSEDPDELAAKVKGTILLLSSVIIWLAAATLHITLTANDIVQLATEASGVVGSVWVAYGLIKHLIIWLLDKYNNKTV